MKQLFKKEVNNTIGENKVRNMLQNSDRILNLHSEISENPHLF
jgi:hypothetical protein